MSRAYPGILIAVEGIDGAGKTTQVDLLARFFLAAGEPVLCSREPTAGPWGLKIRESARNGRMNLADELKAFIEDRKEHVADVILPALKAGTTVILDRYFYSTIAYQGSRGGCVDATTAQASLGVPEPDAVILLDVPPEVGLVRISEGRGETPNAFEKNGNLAAARKVFHELAKSRDNVLLIDGTPPAEAVRQQILNGLLGGILYRRHCAKHWGCDDVFNCAYRMTGECRWANMKKAAAEFAYQLKS